MTILTITMCIEEVDYAVNHRYVEHKDHYCRHIICEYDDTWHAWLLCSCIMVPTYISCFCMDLPTLNPVALAEEKAVITTQPRTTGDFCVV